MATKILQGAPPLLKVCTCLLTEDNSPNFGRGSPTELFFSFFSFFLDLSTGILQGVSPLSFFFLGKSGIISTN